MIKSTYSLDRDTVRKVERLARDWKVSESDVVKRLVAEAKSVEEKPVSEMTPLEAFHALQEHLNLTPEKARKWEAESKRIRRNAFRNREWTRP